MRLTCPLTLWWLRRNMARPRPILATDEAFPALLLVLCGDP
jgi:hypothetical protein